LLGRSILCGETRTIVADLKPWTGDGIYVSMLDVDETDRAVEA